MDSRYSWEVEVSRAIEREARGDNITVIPIIVSECDWKHTPLGERQGLPRNGKPITEWQQRDKAWTEVAKEIRTLVI